MRRRRFVTALSIALALGTSTSALAETCSLLDLGCMLSSGAKSQPAPGAAPVQPAYVPQPAPTPEPTYVPPAPADIVEPSDVLEERLFALVNAERAAAGVAMLSVEGWARDVARGHSARMGAAMDLWHNNDYMRTGRRSIGANLLGENVAMATTIEAAHQMLMDSPAHRRNLLDPRFTHAGIGVYQDQGFVFVTEDFARKGKVKAKATKKSSKRSKRSRRR